MTNFISDAIQNLATPMILFFVLGFISTIIKSDIEIPQAISKVLAIYFMIAIGFKGGVEISKTGIDISLYNAIINSVFIGISTPIVAFLILKYIGKIDNINSGAISAHYGSVSVVTFVTAISFLNSKSIDFSGYMAGMMALMESPAIFVSILLVRIFSSQKISTLKSNFIDLLKESLFNSSVVLLFGSLVIGLIVGEKGMTSVKPFLVDPFNGILTLFLLDMGMIAGQRISEFKKVGFFLSVFAICMPVMSASITILMSSLFNFSLGDTFLFSVLAASSSYIAAPAAVRIALPQANPAYYITMSLAITFPFNIMFGIPLYFSLINYW
ncbi:MAG: sodium-dependent bicarbonate transport family permease [Ignavibacterium sp.]|nr:sodium-dependent bicarbonate transport family permease [Ignavibacterium sp.]MCX7612049.1 sodium-dependent bicarbonate transport family permease [Ignavibacterium sp.]MDW8374804.1 sodium-dependent bicarbonate transport family permease [Ignavibacteriales bacterium]